MNKIFYTFILLLFCQAFSNVRASELEMSERDFTRFVCGSLHQAEDKTQAFDEIYNTIKSTAKDSQLAMLKEIENSDSAMEDYCGSALPRF